MNISPESILNVKNLSPEDAFQAVISVLTYILGTMAASDTSDGDSTFLETLKKNISIHEQMSDAAKALANAIIYAADLSAKTPHRPTDMN